MQFQSREFGDSDFPTSEKSIKVQPAVAVDWTVDLSTVYLENVICDLVRSRKSMGE